MAKEDYTINEVLALTMQEGENITSIAQKSIVGEKELRRILKSVDCEPTGSGLKGWIHKGDDSADLNQKLSQLTVKKKGLKSSSGEVTANSAELNASKSKSKNSGISNNNDDIIKSRKSNNIENKTSNSKNANKKENAMIDEIQALIKGTNKTENNRIYKGVYFDKDIAFFLDNIQHGNKSELINKIIRKYLIENDLL